MGLPIKIITAVNPSTYDRPRLESLLQLILDITTSYPAEEDTLILEGDPSNSRCIALTYNEGERIADCGATLGLWEVVCYV
jgi:hypothetical protein